MCGAQLGVSGESGEQRKLVSVLFCDVVGSTALGEHLEAESLRRVLSDYFAVARSVVERHGGVVEKFIGDAVMAVFGVPRVHEDDAIRAVRAAIGIREEVATLNRRLNEQFEVTLAVRIGICTGEVITGTEERLATGDVLNTAARLEQAAGPGEILLEETTLRLVRSTVEVEALNPLRLRGKRKSTPTYRLAGIIAEPSVFTRRLAPLVGRGIEISSLKEQWQSVLGERACRVVTVSGTPGVGKSRLAAEFIGSLDEATVLRARCLPYGEGISYWPIVAILKRLGSRLDELDLDRQTRSSIDALLSGGTVSSEDISFAVRRLFEILAATKPLLVVFDDIQWGQQTFLDLVRYLVGYSSDAPILVLCLARPELHDTAPDWQELSYQTIRLEPLSETDSEYLVSELASELDGELRQRVLHAAGGNPLFVEEMVGLIREQGDQSTEIKIPTTIHALIGARLDQLQPTQRRVLQQGSIEGEVFHRSAVAAIEGGLSPNGAKQLNRRSILDSALLMLVNKDFLRPDRPQIAGDDAFRFRHLLIRDTAYASLTKNVRADLHERLANWLDTNATNIVELDELVGYHLEQAFHYRQQLGRVDDNAKQLAQHAADRLLESGKRAENRGDIPAAKNLFTRAAKLLPEGTVTQREALFGLAMILRQDDINEAAEIFERVYTSAEESGDKRLAARAQVGLYETELLNGDYDLLPTRQKLENIIPELEELSDNEGLAWALDLLGKLFFWGGSCEYAEPRWEYALDLIEKTQSPTSSLSIDLLSCLVWSAMRSTLPTDQAIVRCQELAKRGEGNSYLLAVSLVVQGLLKAMRGSFEEGRTDMQAGREMMIERGSRVMWAMCGAYAGLLELYAERPAIAESILREALPTGLETAKGYGGFVLLHLALVVSLQGRSDETLELVERASALAGQAHALNGREETDYLSKVYDELPRVRALMQKGELKRAFELAEAVIRWADTTDWMPWRIMAWQAFADVAREAKQTNLEIKAQSEVVRLAAIKADLVSQRRAQKRLSELGVKHTAVSLVGERRI